MKLEKVSVGKYTPVGRDVDKPLLILNPANTLQIPSNPSSIIVSIQNIHLVMDPLITNQPDERQPTNTIFFRSRYVSAFHSLVGKNNVEIDIQSSGCILWHGSKTVTSETPFGILDTITSNVDTTLSSHEVLLSNPGLKAWIKPLDAYLDLPAVGSLSTGGGGWGIGLGKAATKDANAPSKKVKYNPDTIFELYVFFCGILRSCRVDYDTTVISINCSMKINFKVERPAPNEYC